jgi:hypothetical protein
VPRLWRREREPGPDDALTLGLRLPATAASTAAREQDDDEKGKN